MVRVWFLVLEVRKAIDDRISHRAMRRVKVNFFSDTVSFSKLCPRLHFFEHGNAFLRRPISAKIGETVPTVFLLSIRVGIVGIGIALADHLLADVIELLGVVTRVADLICL
jgi:hypothetical protein